MTKMEKLMKAHNELIKAQANYERALEEALIGEEYHVILHIKTFGHNIYDHVIVDDKSEAKALSFLASNIAHTLIGDTYHLSREIADCKFYQGGMYSGFAQIGYGEDYNKVVNDLNGISY